MEPQIVAMGGGGFAMEPENLLLEQYVLSLSRNRIRPRVCLRGAAPRLGGYRN
jgi:dipeptidase E